MALGAGEILKGPPYVTDADGRLGGTGGGGGGAVTVADGADVTQGAKADAEAAAGNGSVVALLKRIRTLLSGTLTVDPGTPDVSVVNVPSVTVADGVGLEPTTSGGLAIFRSLDLDETEEDVKASPGQLFGYFIANRSAGERFVKLYNAAAAAVVVGTTVPVITIPLAAGEKANVEFTNGLAFSTAICAAATTGVADNDVGAPGVNDVVTNFFYK